MRLCYLDDSGRSGKNLQDRQQPHYILGGLVVPSAQWRGAVQALKAVIRKATDELPRNEGRRARRDHGHS